MSNPEPTTILTFPNELLTKVLSHVENPRDLLHIGLTNKLLYKLAGPFLYKSITFVIPGYQGEWHVDEPFSKVTDMWVGFIRNIEVVNAHALFLHPVEIDSLPMHVVIKDKGSIPRVHATSLGQIEFNERLSSLISGLKPGQLQSFT
ncbi:hypothetical protein ABW21_db0209546 [Orbilia brochopaga]|nr:hypothetical protein ABW21_db0209546 [Drechslerella brochopaga]